MNTQTPSTLTSCEFDLKSRLGNWLRGNWLLGSDTCRLVLGRRGEVLTLDLG